jgi:hypothetical protein
MCHVATNGCQVTLRVQETPDSNLGCGTHYCDSHFVDFLSPSGEVNGIAHVITIDRFLPHGSFYHSTICSLKYVGVLISLWLFLFAAQPKEFILGGLKKLERSHKCGELRGEYVEKITFSQSRSLFSL